ncbi:hypothetical protein FRC11_005625 [Ceratobasidium sp. 423]|nr:hypothetical protein FRC11_005625 [Ceratobasidium sp. 423]
MEENTANSFPCPYVLGATFKLEVSPPQGTPFVTEAKVVHLYAPFTMSSVMKVALTPRPAGTVAPSEAILKVYDRRFAGGLRKRYQVPPTTIDREVRYAEYLASGNIAQTKDEIDNQFDEVPEGDPDPPELEERLVALAIKPFFENEKTTYSTLSSLQGKYIPTFYGSTKFLEDTSSLEIDTTVPGILIEYIPGTNLSRIDPSAVDLDAICTAAVHIVNTYSNFNVLNRDVRFENFIVKPSGSEIVMIDFGHCRLRKVDEDDQAWKEAKWSEDEEGAVGDVANRKFGWTYVPSERFTVYVDDTDMEEEFLDSEMEEDSDS